MKITNNHGLPAPLVEAVKNDRYKSTGDISVTALIGPPLRRQIMKRHDMDISEDAADRIWSLLGQSVHHVLERANTKDALAEERLSVKINGWNVSGGVDLYEETDGGTITDYKVTSVFAFLLGDKPEWERQLNCYAHIYRAAGFPVKNLRITAILRDHSKTKALSDPQYPKVPVMNVSLPVWSDEAVKAYMAERVKMHKTAEGRAFMSIPPCNAQESWKRADSWAAIKKGNKRATKVFDNSVDAAKFAVEKKLEVVERPGEWVRCARFCSALKFCEVGQRRVETKAA